MSKKESSLAFDGMAGDGVNRADNCWSGNQYRGGKTVESTMTNVGMGPRVGNKSSSADPIGPSATRDAKKLTIATAAQGGKINGGAARKEWPNADKINVGMKK
jgi:hypothetical protein